MLFRSLKDGTATATALDRKELLDSLADQVVTSVGVGYRAKMNRCRKGLASYHRLAGIPKVPKG